MLKALVPRPKGDFISPSPWVYPELGLTSQGAGEWEGTGQLNKIPFIF